jgi:CRP-like cAMP-binding protein
MAMRLKLAQTAKELDDVFWLRHEVYVMEAGKFQDNNIHDRYIVDRFDAFSECVHIIAYENREPVGTLRICLDSELGLPSEEYFGLASHRAELERETQERNQSSVLLTCAGMLAVRQMWKNRRDVIRALIKMAVGVWHSWKVTHVYATVNHETVSMYDRLGFSPIAEKVWIESIGDFVIPILAPFEGLYQWAFGPMQNGLLDAYSGHFERLLLKPGEVLFSEGDLGDYAYMVDEGTIKVSRHDISGCELILATLEQGELFGELALIDTSPRSASAIAMKATELIVLDRQTFQDRLITEPNLMELVMRNFSKRIRRMDDLAMVLAYGAHSQRLNFALQALRKKAKPDAKMPKTYVVRISPKELANLAGVSTESALSFLESHKNSGELDFTHRSIRFFDRRSQSSEQVSVGKEIA